MTREEAIQRINEYIAVIEHDGRDWVGDDDLPWMEMAIEALSQEVIRCKECKYKNTICNYCHKHDMNVTLESYCSWAERKTDRDCDNCVHHTEQGCTKWDCEFERIDK